MLYSPWIGINNFGFINLNISFCSSWEPCPEVWMLESLPLITSAPALYKALIVLFTLSVLPGIGDEENTTVSSGMILICLCVPFAIRDSAAIGSPCEPVQRIRTLCFSILLIIFGSIKVSGGALI